MSQPGLARIAELHGVSVATVSNALSGKGRVSSGLAERIRATAAELGYVPSQAGRALRTGRTGVLGLVLPDIANPLFPQIAQAVEFAASAAGYGVLIADSRGDVSTQTDAIDRLIERGVDGMVVVPRRGTRIVEVGCPVVVVDTPSTPGNTVSADHWEGGRQIARHLMELGHRRALLIGANPDSNVQNDRIGGMRAGFDRLVATETLWTERLELQRGPGCPLGLLRRFAEGFTAFAATSDLLALRALTELQGAGIAVPERASVTGFDDLVFSAVVSPPLTTMRMDMDRIAAIAMESLMDAIAEGGRAGPVASPVSSIPMQLVVRNSSGRPDILESPTP